MKIREETFAETKEVDAITLFILGDGKGVEAKLINYGAILVSFKAPDRDGKSEDITLGYESLDGYMQDSAYLGATVGRYENRISKARCTL